MVSRKIVHSYSNEPNEIDRGKIAERLANENTEPKPHSYQSNRFLR